MKILESSTVEICVDGTSIRELLLDEEISEDFINHLSALGRLEYFAKLPRPFFRVTWDGCYVVKGIQGNRSLQVHYISSPDEHEKEIAILIGSYHHHENG
jgi:hypothetical protein